MSNSEEYSNISEEELKELSPSKCGGSSVIPLTSNLTVEHKEEESAPDTLNTSTDTVTPIASSQDSVASDNQTTLANTLPSKGVDADGDAIPSQWKTLDLESPMRMLTLFDDQIQAGTVTCFQRSNG